MLEANALSKTYRNGFTALHHATFSLEQGVIGLVGPNGAGKSTLLRILATVSQPTQGALRWRGEDVTKKPDLLRRELGYLPQDFNAYPQLTAREFLQYIGAIKGIKGKEGQERIAWALEMVNLAQSADRPIGSFSGGMRQRVGVAQALLNDPSLLIMDEPTVGLDPTERNRFRNLIASLSANRLVILSTHIIADIEATASHVTFLFKGRLLPLASPSELLKKVEGKVWDVLSPENAPPPVGIVASTARRADGRHLRLITNQPPVSAEPQTPTLEDVYVWELEQLTQEGGQR